MCDKEQAARSHAGRAVSRMERSMQTMSRFTKFMKENKAVKPNEQYAPRHSLTDEKGAPLLWEFRYITSAENEALRESCTVETPVAGKPNLYRPRLKTSLYMQKLIAASVVMPDLYDAELQDSYGVKTPEELLLALVDDPGEYADLAAWVQKFQGFDTSFEDKVDAAKN